MASANGLSDADKQVWMKRMLEEPGFRDALILETYITIKALSAMAEQVAVQMAALSSAGGLLAKLGVGVGKDPQA